MFQSTGNNFGGGVIQFKDVQEENYVVLNAFFKYNSSSAEYLAADVLEIYVPSLSIERSAETGVVVKFEERTTYGSYVYNYDGGTVAKSWVKDRNTICVEKVSALEHLGEITVYIQSFFCMLGRSSSATKLAKKTMKFTTDGNYLSVNSSYTFCIISERWIFLHISFSGCSYAYQKMDWDAFVSALPDDVSAVLPVIQATNYNHAALGSIGDSSIEEGYWSMPSANRAMSFFNTGNDVFCFAYLVRDNEPEPEVKGRLRIAEDPLRGSGTVQMSGFDMELSPSPAVAAVAGSTGQYGKTYAYLYPTDVPDGMPEFESYHLGALLQGQGIGIQLVKMTVKNLPTRPEIDFNGISRETNLAMELFDSSPAVQL